MHILYSSKPEINYEILSRDEINGPKKLFKQEILSDQSKGIFETHNFPKLKLFFINSPFLFEKL